MCECESIKGSLYTCLVCPDFMTCETCERLGKHEHDLFETISKYNQNFEKAKFFSQPLPI